MANLLAGLRVLSVITAFLMLMVGMFFLSEKAPRLALTAAFLAFAGVFALEARDFRRRHDSRKPAWLDHARCYYSEVGPEESDDPVNIFDASTVDEASSDSPGKLVLRLEPRSLTSARVRVLDAGGCERGVIRSVGFVPGLTYAMRRNGELVWKLSVRSIVRKRHALKLASGDSWTFETPFFWWQNLTGTANGAIRLVGGLVWDAPSHALWGVWVAPGSDTFDMLAAVAFMHRQYAHW
jgi:hypothetical protein